MKLVRFLLFLYRSTISPAVHLVCGPGFGCRFEPSCSAYCKQAVETHGLISGLELTLKRLFRCHPFARAGYDPVPHAIDRKYGTSESQNFRSGKV
ncbi:MAG: membrane protein insertion efficiency factor YidD [Bdellovibrio sp.]|nr:membrane protein insertion efficiency factor YidD [Bdellovibrio sp.]